MFQFLKNSSADKALADALGRSQAVIEFDMDGTILTANDNFLKALGYSLGEIQGKHHSMFVDPSERDSAAYRDFWAALKRGEYQAAEYKRIGKGGKEVWIQATYNPVLDADGKPVKVVKFATDITARKIKSMEDAGQIAAIGRAQAVIAFEMDGTIVTANENFLRAIGYTLAEIQGKHHSMFVEQASATARPIASSGQSSTAAKTSRPNTSGSARAARKSGSSPPITRCSTRRASRSGW